MDVRLSSASNYSKPVASSDNLPGAKKSETQSSELGNVNTSTELKTLERQGMSVSTGEEQVIKALDRAFKALEGPTTTFEVSIHKETKAIMVKVLNKDTGELIREVPPEKTLDLVANLMEVAGIIVDAKV
ncbi:flagellar protein FlaG [Paenibacillus sp. NFR01]|uniref:flagellar protein FlaG n=1 Tax=Paenibacillus sp. NFR01 TaxID=1566279 RepID=UPI0008CCBC01|nr:flagellar protein FlaG [Paenibacillus sp. NFR01]SEU14344.1 flagellar protein FlaG [Paenibacillus sp. NFR01]